MDTKDFINRQGYCPRCEHLNLDYGSPRFEDTMVYFPWKCKDCGLEGEEWYSMNFQGHNVYDEEGNIIEL